MGTLDDLRDQFAMAAMQGLLASESWKSEPDYRAVARISYMMAAAMLSHRRENSSEKTENS